jgi:hypothetical protein
MNKILLAGLAVGCLLLMKPTRASFANQQLADLIQSIERVKLHDGRQGSPTWFLPRVCIVPQQRGALALMTLQTIAGSDYYGPVHWRASRDNGQTWSAPQPVPNFGRRPYQDDIEEAVSDVTPFYHTRTNAVIALGEIIYYRDGKYFPEQPPRYPVYAVRDAKGNWSERRKLEWDDPRTTAIYATGSAQTVVRPDGDVLIPVSFRPKERADYAVTTLLYGFDGQTLKFKQAGNELNNTAKRGLLEPQLIYYNRRYLLTIRAEDGFGYVSASSDGLQWSTPVSWRWDDGEPLAMSTTQQHWLTHSDGLYLVYTRKAEQNVNVMRWRAPLYLARVDTTTLRLLRATERIVFPLIGDGINDPTNVAHYGNFHANEVSPQESWVLAGEVIPANFRGDMLLARVRWRRPNRLVK